jgi:hypothetical protein
MHSTGIPDQVLRPFLSGALPTVFARTPSDHFFFPALIFSKSFSLNIVYLLNDDIDRNPLNKKLIHLGVKNNVLKNLLLLWLFLPLFMGLGIGG